MAIERIDPEACVGCGKCVICCPADVLRMDNEKNQAIIKYPQDCVICCWCIVECPKNAIYLSPTKRTILFTSWG